MSRIKKTFVSVLIVIILINTLFYKVSAVAEPDVTAKNVLLIHLNTGRVMYERNANEKIYPGFLTKIMTALIVMEKTSNLDEMATVGSGYSAGIDYYSSLAFKETEQISVKDLLYCLIVSTSGEAANILAQHISGSNEEFVKLMNERAKQLGANNTLFTSPHGINDNVAYTTAYDAAAILKTVIENTELIKICDTTFYTTSPTNLSPIRDLYSTNYIIIPKMTDYYLGYVTGIKNGYDKTAGYSLATLAERNKNKILCIVFGSEKTTIDNVNTIHSFIDTKKLVDWVTENYAVTTVITKNTPCLEIAVKLSAKHDSVMLISSSDFKTLMPKDFDSSKLVLTPQIPSSINAPVTKGQKVGTLLLSYEGIDITTVDLLANSDVKVDMLLYYGYQITSFFGNIWVKLSTVLVVLLFMLYIFYTVFYNKKRKKFKTVRRRIRY